MPKKSKTETLDKAEPTEENAYLVAANMVEAWAQEYKRYLLDGDPNILHPKARTALTLKIADKIEAAYKVAFDVQMR